MSNSRRRCGFTLIEVLVVVAIIALLVAILLPSLNRARETTRATVCATHIKESLSGTLLHFHESGMRRENWSTNFGWATYSQKVTKGTPELVSCPSDDDPLVIPAVFDRLHAPLGGDQWNYRGTTTSDAIYNRIRKLGSGSWELDIQDIVDNEGFGFDAYYDPASDIKINYDATPGEHSAQGVASTGNAAWKHEIYSIKGDYLWTAGAGKDAGGVRAVAVMPMSYGANASAGLKNVKGNPILVAESRKLGLFPETLGDYQSDYLQRALRFRHGNKSGLKGLQGADYAQNVAYSTLIPGANNPVLGNRVDRSYEPRSRLNAGFFDGHVESITYQQMFMDFDSTAAERTRATPKASYWLGTRRGRTTF